MTVDVGGASRRWRLQPEPDSVPRGEWPPLIGRLLAHRGVHTVVEALAFFDTAGLAPPVLPDLDKAASRLAEACRAGETVAVFGDFDVDGITAAALLTEGLTSLGAKAIPYLPHRVKEGYGLNSTAIESLRGQGATVLVTADCGTRSVEDVAFARSSGMDVVIVDHHTVPSLLPPATAIVNPKRAEGSADERAACGVAYYTMLALHEALGQAPDEAPMLELVALGTICDLVPLVADNRRLVRDGLAALSWTARPGLRALLEVSGIDATNVDAEAVAFSLGPRLNAAGRLAHARIAFDLLVCQEEERGRELAGELNALNRQRQEATQAAVELAEELAAEEPGAPLIMIGSPDLHTGIVGLVASRLVEAHYRPAVVYEQGERTSRASARSIERFDITGALRTCDDLLAKYGGHAMAAGFTARNEHLPAIKDRLLAQAESQLAGLDLTPSIDVDAELPLSELRGEEIRWLSRLAPHGAGNREPTFLSRNVTVVERRLVGQDAQHLRLKLRDGSVVWPAIAFRQQGDGIEEGGRADFVYTVAVDRRSAGGLELRVLDLRPAQD